MLTLTIISNKLLTTNKTQQTNKEIKPTKKKELHEKAISKLDFVFLPPAKPSRWI